MTKRKCYEDDYSRQFKFHVGEYDVSVDVEQHKESVQEKTLKMLYGKLLPGSKKSNTVENGYDGSENINHAKSKKVNDFCCANSDKQPTSKCTYCEKHLCTECTVVCIQCRHYYCTACVFMRYTDTGDFHICLSCYSYN